MLCRADGNIHTVVSSIVNSKILISAALKTQQNLYFVIWPVLFNVNNCRCVSEIKAASILQLNNYSESLLKNYCGYYISTLSTLYKLHPLVDKLFMSVMAFCWSCPFPSSNPGSNKRGLTSVTRAYKSPLHQMESAAEWGMEVSG